MMTFTTANSNAQVIARPKSRLKPVVMKFFIGLSKLKI